MNVEVDFYKPLQEVQGDQLFQALRALLPTTEPRELTTDQFHLSVRPLPPLHDLNPPVLQTFPAAYPALFGFENDGSFDGVNTLVVAEELSDDELWIFSVRWRASLRWRSLSYAALREKACGVLMKLVGASEQIPGGAHGIVHLGIQEWTRSDLREARWARIIEELDKFHHSAKVRIPYMFINRLVSRVTPGGGFDVEENCLVLTVEGVGVQAEADKLPHNVFVIG